MRSQINEQSKKNPTRIKNYHHKNTNSNSLQKKKNHPFQADKLLSIPAKMV